VKTEKEGHGGFFSIKSKGICLRVHPVDKNAEFQYVLLIEESLWDGRLIGTEF